MFYFDLTDIVEFSRHSNQVSGIQRVVLNTAKALSKRNDVQFVFYRSSSATWYVVEGLNFFHENLKIYNRLANDWRLGKMKWSYARRAFRESRGLRGLKYLSRYIRSHFSLSDENTIDGITVKRWDYMHSNLSETDHFIISSIPFNSEIYEKFLNEIKNTGIIISFFFHDIIPVVSPEFTWQSETKNFEKYVHLMHTYADVLLTSAKFNVRDYEKYVEEHFDSPGNYPIKAIGLPVDFNIEYSKDDYQSISAVSRRLKFYKYCLSVGSIGPRKNHFELLQAWKKFYESSAYNNELLVIAGAPWASAPDIVELLRSHFCGGSVIFVDAPCDKELSYLYDHCKFTLCLSLYEGWGLPVSESIAVGKPVVILNETTLSEAGYGVANIVPTRNLCDMQKEIERLFNDENYYKRSLEKVLQIQNKMPTWDDFTHRMLASLLSK